MLRRREARPNRTLKFSRRCTDTTPTDDKGKPAARRGRKARGLRRNRRRPGYRNVGGNAARRSQVFVLVAAPLVATTTGVAGAKGKPAPKPPKKASAVAHVFQGEVIAVDADSVLTSVEGGNSFAKPFFGKQLDVSPGCSGTSR